MPGMKTGLWLRNFPYTLSEIFLLNSLSQSVTHYCIILAVELLKNKMGKLLELWWGSLHTISLLIFIL